MAPDNTDNKVLILLLEAIKLQNEMIINRLDKLIATNIAVADGLDELVDWGKKMLQIKQGQMQVEGKLDRILTEFMGK